MPSAGLARFLTVKPRQNPNVYLVKYPKNYWHRRCTMRNRVTVALGIIAALVVIALLALPSFIDVNHYRPQIEAELRQRLGRDVSLGPMRLSLLPLAFRVDNAAIGEDPQFNTGRPFAQVQILFVRPKLLPLLHHDVEIKSSR